MNTTSSGSNNDAKVRGLLTRVPGNLECADCGKSGKALVKFCSVKLGVFLCNQCYAAHRALGAHITRGKCIGLDGFTDQEVTLLETNGNHRVNALYEANLPRGTCTEGTCTVKPPPTKCNGCSLRSCNDCAQRLSFIRQKYEEKRWYSDTPTSTSTSDDPFGLFAGATCTGTTMTSNQSQGQGQAQTQAQTQSQTQLNQQQKPNKQPSDADFFASFGL